MNKTPLPSRIIASTIFAVLIVAVFVLHIDKTANPPAHAPEKTPALANRGAVYAPLSPEAVGETFTTIADFG
jgi:hypothetical protein